jgi:hypothetical protein
MGINRFDLVTFWCLTYSLKFDYDYGMMCTGTLIFHMSLSVPCDKVFPWSPTGLILTEVFELLYENLQHF